MKKILLSLVVIVALFGITGCGKNDGTSSNDNNSKTTNDKITVDGVDYSLNDEIQFHDLLFKYPKDSNFKDFETGDNDKGTRGFRFYKDNEALIGVVISYYKNKDLNYVYSERNVKDKDKTVTFNNISWYDDTANTFFYYRQNGNDLYAITIIILEDANINKDEFVNTFMNNVRFK